MSELVRSRGLADEIYGLLLEPIGKWGISHNDLVRNRRIRDSFLELCFALSSLKYKMEQGKKFEICGQCRGSGWVEIEDVRELPISPGKYTCGKCKGTGETEISELEEGSG